MFVLAVTVAFLVGSVLLVLAAGGQATAIAAEFESPGSATLYDTSAAAREAAPDDAVVIPVATVRLPDGSPTIVAGVPPDAVRRFDRRDVTLRTTKEAPTWGDLDTAKPVTLASRDTAITVEIEPRDPRASLLPPSWIVDDTETVRRLGSTGAFVLYPDGGQNQERGGAPLVAALEFFLAGTRQALALLGVVVAGGAALVAVTVFSVTRMSVRDRLTTIRIVRSTGGRPTGILGLFAVRALLLTVVGVALGYAFGIILTRAAVNLAVAVGLPTSLAIRVTPRAVRVLVPALLGLLAVGAIAGLAAAWPAARKPPAQLTDTAARTTPARTTNAAGQWLRTAVAPTLLAWRALVPSTATLAAFVAFVALIAAMAGVAGPLAATDGATVTEPDSTHPVNSQVPAAYADALRARGIDASAEILLFEVVDARPVPARGADYAAFASVTDARLVRGRAPRTADEAVVGVDAAATLGVGVGDHLTLGGSTRPALTQVSVVGIFVAPGPFDDQVVVSLATARHLSTVRPGQANVIRTSRLPERAGPNRSVGIVDVNVPKQVVANGSLPVRITIRNDAQREYTMAITARFRGQSRTVRITVPGTSSRTATVRFDAGPPGMSNLRVETITKTIRVVEPGTMTLTGLPADAPPGSEPLVRVVNATGHPVAGATVRVRPGNRTVETDADGSARVPLEERGTVTVTATRGEYSARTNVTVSTGGRREPTAALRVSPATPSLLTRPTAEITLSNPWNRTLARTVTVEGPGGAYTHNLTLGPGERTTLTVHLATRPPGEYGLQVHTAGTTLATTTYRVTGDERVVSALASSGRAGSTAIGRAIAVAFGNLQVVLGALVALAGLMTVGATTATFAQAVHARRTTVGIRRATGAGPRAVLGLVLADALRIGVVASALALVLALGALWGLDVAGYLIVFGVRLAPMPPPAVLVGTAAAALGLTLLGAGLATASLLARPPAALVAGERTARAGRAEHPRRSGNENPGASERHTNSGGEPDG